MELQTYWAIIWRRLWIIALVVGVVALYVGYQYYHLRKTPGALKAYSSAVTIQIGLQATTKGNTNTADYITVSQALADSFATGPILSSHEFDKAISDQIGQDMGFIQQRFGPNPDLGDWQSASAIGGSLGASRVDSLVTIGTTWNTPEGAWAITNAVGEVSTSQIGNFLDYVVSNDPTHSSSSTGTFQQPAVAARVISHASSPATISGSANSKLTLYFLLLLVALALGIALAFLLDYLDDRIRSKDQVTHLLELPILGEIPRAPVPGGR